MTADIKKEKQGVLNRTLVAHLHIAYLTYPK